MNYPLKHVEAGIYRGPRPSLEDLKDLKAFGIATVLNLENDTSAREEESQRCAELGILSLNLQMSEWTRPTCEQLRAAVMSLCASTLRPILVHCLHGQDRTGYVIAAYRILVDGWSVDAAYKEAKDNGHKWLWYWHWKKSLKELANGK